VLTIIMVMCGMSCCWVLLRCCVCGRGGDNDQRHRRSPSRSPARNRRPPPPPPPSTFQLPWANRARGEAAIHDARRRQQGELARAPSRVVATFSSNREVQIAETSFEPNFSRPHQGFIPTTVAVSSDVSVGAVATDIEAPAPAAVVATQVTTETYRDYMAPGTAVAVAQEEHQEQEEEAPPRRVVVEHAV
jgi:hypothetical protein